MERKKPWCRHRSDGNCLELAWSLSLREEQPETARQRDGDEGLSQGSNSPSTKKEDKVSPGPCKAPAQCPQQQCLSLHTSSRSVHGARRYLYAVR